MRFAALILVAGCGRVAFDARLDAGDGGVIDDITDASDAASTATACGLVGNLRDTFEGTAYDADRYAQTYVPPGTSITVTGGEILLQGPSNTAGQYVGLVTSRHYNARGSRFVAEVTSVPTSGEIVGIQLSNGGSLVIMSYSAGSLTAAQRAPTYVQHVSIPYAPTEHRFWAISESGGIVSWETSSDGVTFVPIAQMPEPFDLSRVRTDVFAGAETNVAAPQPFRLTSLGAPNAEPYRACPPQFTETFDDPEVLKGLWLNSFTSPCCSHQIAGGVFTTTTDATAGYSWLRSAEGYDLRGHRVSAELVQFEVEIGVAASLVLTRDYSNKLGIIRGENSWDVFERVDGIGTGNPYSIMSETFLRFVVDDTTYSAQVSADGQTWRTLRTAPHPFALDDVAVELETGSVGGTSGPGMYIWDNVTAQ